LAGSSSAIVRLLMEIIRQYTGPQSQVSTDNGISLTNLINEVKRKKQGLVKDPASNFYLSPQSFPGKLKIRNIVLDFLLPQGLVEIRVDNLPVKEVSRIANGKPWKILATKASAQYDVTILNASQELKSFRAVLKNISQERKFERKDFFVFESFLTNLSVFPLRQYFELSNLSPEIRWDLVSKFVGDTRHLFDELMEVRRKQLGFYPQFDQIVQEIKEVKEAYIGVNPVDFNRDSGLF
jgi:hypothetical protein